MFFGSFPIFLSLSHSPVRVPTAPSCSPALKCRMLSSALRELGAWKALAF